MSFTRKHLTRNCRSALGNYDSAIGTDISHDQPFTFNQLQPITHISPTPSALDISHCISYSYPVPQINHSTLLHLQTAKMPMKWDSTADFTVGFLTFTYSAPSNYPISFSPTSSNCTISKSTMPLWLARWVSVHPIIALPSDRLPHSNPCPSLVLTTYTRRLLGQRNQAPPRRTSHCASHQPCLYPCRRNHPNGT